MELGFGLYKHMLNKAHFEFARQCGATHLIVHLVDYFRGGIQGAHDQPRGGLSGWGYAGDPNKLWSVDELVALKREVESHGLVLWGIESFDPAHWFDILLDGKERKEQIAKISQIIRNVGRAGIGVIGYNFSLAGVSGRGSSRNLRGNAEGVAMHGRSELTDTPLPLGMVWNMIYDQNAPAGTLQSITHEELWDRLKRFLNEVIPVAEESGVRLGLHPDDPPLETVRGQPRLVYQPSMYDRALQLVPSKSNALAMCLGTIQEMTQGSVYEACDQYTKNNNAPYIHLRNVVGKVPNYCETFIDEGDIDIMRVFRILHKNNYDGVIIPDHAPQMNSDAPWHTGIAFAMGYLKAAMTAATTSSS